MKSKLEDRIWTPIASRLRGGTSSPPSIRLSVAFAFAFAFAFALAITLCGFSVTLYAPLKISLADIAIGSALLHALLHLRQARISSITLPMVVFAGILLLSGMITAWRFEYFDELNFAINFARIVAIVVIVALLPTFFRSMGYETMVRAVLWAFRVNAIVLLVDAVGLLPDVFSPVATLVGPANGLLPRAGMVFRFYIVRSFLPTLCRDRSTTAICECR